MLITVPAHTVLEVFEGLYCGCRLVEHILVCPHPVPALGVREFTGQVKP